MKTYIGKLNIEKKKRLFIIFAKNKDAAKEVMKSYPGNYPESLQKIKKYSKELKKAGIEDKVIVL